MVEVGRSSGPNSLLKQDHLEPFAQDRIQTAFEYLQGWRFYFKCSWAFLPEG